MAQEYFFFLCNLYERPELADDTWKTIRDFYFNHYRIYSKFAIRDLPQKYTRVTLPKIRSRMKKWDKMARPNIIRFINELETELFTPLYYFQ
jgi:hypothetical protein